MRRTAASVSAKVVPPEWNWNTAMGPRREASMGGRDGRQRDRRQGWAAGMGGRDGRRWVWQGRAFRDSVRHRRQGSSGAPALTRPRAVALLEGALEGSLLVPALRQPYLDGSCLGGGARRRQRMAQQQRSAALGLEPIGARGAQPAGHHVRAEGDLPLPAADEQRLAIVPVCGQTQQKCQLGRPLAQRPRPLGGISGAGPYSWALLPSSEGSPKPSDSAS